MATLCKELFHQLKTLEKKDYYYQPVNAAAVAAATYISAHNINMKCSHSTCKRKHVKRVYDENQLATRFEAIIHHNNKTPVGELKIT